MVYIKKKVRKLIKSMDDNFTISLGMRNWVSKKIYVKHNLIIKSSGVGYCTNCKSKFKTADRVGSLCRCPNCNQLLQVRKSTLSYYNFKSDFRVVEYLDGFFILRGFEVSSTYQGATKSISHNFVEYQRLVISKEEILLLSSNVFKVYLSTVMVIHNEKHTSWRASSHGYGWYASNGIIYWNNLSRDIKNSPYQYCPIERTLKKIKVKTLEVILQRILINPISFELLSKLKLYSLARCCDSFTNSGSFEKRFGVPKSYLPFMVEHNISYKGLHILQVVRKTDISLIKRIYNLTCFDELMKYVDIEKAFAMGLTVYNEHFYRDYLEMANTLGMNMKDKKVLYPVNIVESHNELLKQIEDIKQQEIIEKIKIRYEELKGNSYQDEKFAVFPASSMSSLILESQMQNNCVRTYGERYANHEVDLYFMRLLSNLEHSLVTIEVRGNEVVQCRIKNNASCTKEQMAFINKWERKVLMKEKLYCKV